MNPEDIPSITKVKNAIEKLKKTEFPKFDERTSVEEYVASVVKRLHSEFGFMLNMIQPSTCRRFPKIYFRVRALDTFTNVNLIREHSYPPIDIVKMGRCNFPSHPVFYCSNDPKIALLEVARSQSTQRDYCISKWELVRSNQSLFFESFVQIPLSDDNGFNLLKNNLEQRISEPFLKSFNKKLDKDQEEGVLEYRKFLDSSFINDFNYSLSASLAHNSIYAKHNFKTDILIYPSVQTLYNGINIAIRPNFVDNNLRLKCLYILRLNECDINKGKISINLLKYGEVRNSEIDWKDIDMQDSKIKRQVFQDFGHPASGQ